MLNGTDLWPREITGEMVLRQTPSGQVQTYADTPAGFHPSLVASAHRDPRRTCLVDDGGRPWTFGEVLGRVDDLIDALQTGAGIVSGDRVALLLESSVEFCTAVYAINALGAVVVPVPTKFRESEIVALLARSRARLAIVESRFGDVARHSGVATVVCVDDALDYRLGRFAPWGSGHPHAPRSEMSRDAVLMYTSGTTSQSKGALLTNLNVGHAVESYRRILGVTAADRCLLPVPIYHVTGLVAVMALMVHTGGTLVLHRRFDARRVLTSIREERITFLHASPTVFTLLLRQRADFPSLPTWRLAACGSAHMPVARIDELRAWLPGLSFRPVYGLTESSSPAFVMPGWADPHAHAGSSGLPVPGMQAKVVDEGGREVGPSEVGRILLRGANILDCYDGLPDSLHDGWLDTGDLGHLDGEGYLHVVDRVKDMINRGGEKVWCIDVEEELRRIPGITDAAVVGVRDDLYGEVPVALVVSDPSLTLTDEDVHVALARRLPRYQVPVRLRWTDHLPLTANLKVDKRAIRALFEVSSVPTPR